VGGRQFATDSEVQQAIMSWLQALDTDFFYAGVDALVYWWDRCFGKCGDYVKNNLYQGRTMDYTCIYYLNKFMQ
jgi:hypothetical protein